MALPRTFVGFSSTDINEYNLMCGAWKAHEHIDFNFCDCQLQTALNSTNEAYIKQRCRERLDMAGTYIMLIGRDTWLKTGYVKWEAEVAIEKQCRLIAVNLDNWRFQNASTCPPVMVNADAVFVPFSPQIVQWALEKWVRPDPKTHNWYYFQDWVYQQLGYVIDGNIAKRPPKPNPFLGNYRGW
jgi:hypothetical protein